MSQDKPVSPYSQLRERLEERSKSVSDLCETMNELERKFAAGKATNHECNTASDAYHHARQRFGEMLRNSSADLFAALRELEAELGLERESHEVSKRMYFDATERSDSLQRDNESLRGWLALALEIAGRAHRGEEEWEELAQIRKESGV